MMMIRYAIKVALVLAGFGASGAPVLAASFDCADASTPFEHGICDNPELSAADERLAASYATAIGGLSDPALDQIREDQRDWLAYVQRACARDAEPLESGSYDERGLSCLVDRFNGRSTVLEQSRMIEGIRFYPVTRYEAMQDPYEADNPDSWTPVAQHELAMVQMDTDLGFTQVFNDLVRAEGQSMSPSLADGAEPDVNAEDDGSSSDTTNTLVVDEVAGNGRITLKAETYWYGHGAAHGNWAVSYHHFLVKQGRWLAADDLFSGDGWEAALLDLAVAAATAEHGDNLMLDDTSYIADAVVDPTRWKISDPYALIIQFQPYEISAYAYGAPEARVRWDDLADYLAEGAEEIRYGF